ncbi:MAG: thiamine pyrophosphate-binding protein [Brevibacterium yomogidense]
MNASTVSARRLVRALLVSGVRDVVLSPGSRSAPLVYAFADAEAECAESAEWTESSPREARPLRLHVRIDERDAAFTALGIAKAGRLTGVHRPVAVVTTSGSAVGNLHPAVMEAAHAHLPLVLVTADRPARLRGTGANQTLDAQHEALPEVVAAWDLPVPADGEEADGADFTWATAAEAAVTRACTSPGGPVQLNAQFDAPLVPDPDAAGEPVLVSPAAERGAAAFDQGEGAVALGQGGGAVALGQGGGAVALGQGGGAAAPGQSGGADGSGARAEVASGDAGPAGGTAPWSTIRDVLADPQSRPVIVAGDDLGFATRTLADLAAEFCVPVFAEPSSALASHPCTLPAHAQLLGGSASADVRARITHVIVTGRPTLSRPVAQLIGRDDLERITVPYDADGLADTVSELGTRAAEHAPMRAAEDAAAHGAEDGAADGAGTGSWWADWAALASGPVNDSEDPTDAAVLALLERPGVLVAASSNTIRHLARLQRPHHPARVVASRGLAGIDGLVATASGVALGLEDQGAPEDQRTTEDHGAIEDQGGHEEPVRLLIGDLAALHDLGGFVVPTHERRPRLQTVVLHDDGGAIFAGLEHSQPHVASRFDRFFGTPHGTSLAEAARALGMSAYTADLRTGQSESGEAGATVQTEPGRGTAAPAGFREFLDSGAPGLFEIRLPSVRA